MKRTNTTSNRRPANFCETRELWIRDEVKRIQDIVNDQATMSMSYLNIVQTSVTAMVKWRSEIYGHEQGMIDAREEA